MKVRVLRDRFRGLLELLDHAVGSTTPREVARQYGRKTKAWDMDHDSLITVDCWFFSVCWFNLFFQFWLLCLIYLFVFFSVSGPFSQLKVWLGKRPVVEPRYLMYLMVLLLVLYCLLLLLYKTYMCTFLSDQVMVD